MIDIVVIGYKTPEDVEALRRDLPAMTGSQFQLQYYDNSRNEITLTIGWNNLGKIGTGEYLAFLNTDIRLSPGWDQRLIAVLESNPHVGAAIPRPVGHDWPYLADSSQPALVLNDTTPAATPEAMTAIAAKWEPDKSFGIFHHCNAPFYTVMFRRKDWEELKGFDERFRFYGQDHDFQRRLLIRLGKSTVMVHGCPVWHRAAGCVKKAIGTVNFGEEQAHCGRLAGMIASGGTPEWDRLSEDQRVAVRKDSRYNRMPMGA